MPKPLSQEQIGEIKRRFNAGESKTSIAKAMGLADDTISRYTPKVLRHTFITDDLNREIVRLIVSGKSKAEVAKILGLSNTTVGKYSSNIRLATRKAPIPPEIRDEVIRRNLAGELTFPRFFVFQQAGFMLPVFPSVEPSASHA